MERSSGLNRISAAVLLACAALLSACSEEPRDPAPVFALPLSQVIGAPAIENQEPPPATQPAVRQLRYVAVPPGRNVAGMARAHLILKHAAVTPHRAHAHKTKLSARHEGVRAAVAPRDPARAAAPAGNSPPAIIMLDPPAKPEGGKP